MTEIQVTIMAKNKEIQQELQVTMSGLISTLIQETVDADQAVTKDYLNEIQSYAFDMTDKDNPKLKTVSFEMIDDEGKRQRVTVPQISLLPLPMLHISEATFDIEAQMNVIEPKAVENTDPDKLPTIQNVTGIIKPTLTEVNPAEPIYQTFQDPNASAEPKKIAKPIETSENFRKALKASRVVITPLHRALKLGEGNDDVSINSFNAKIHVKLEQSILPSGMMGMLQETDRSITTTPIDQ